MKFSVVITILNEENSITDLLDSLRDQSYTPDEVIIVDAGSRDNTIEKITRWKENNTQIDLELLQISGVNRSKGRNKGIVTANNDWVASTDAGCQAKPDWLEEFAGSIRAHPEAQAVAGYYSPRDMTRLQRVFGLYLCVLPESMIERSYLPSSRSLAFSKIAWDKVGGYPEHLDTCEDLVFAKNLKSCVKMVVNKQAIVEWDQPKNLWRFLRQVSGYARGDVQANFAPHMTRIVSVFWRYVFFIWLPFLFVIYLAYPWFKFRKHISHADDWLYLPVVQVVSDLGVMWGSLSGFWLRLRK